MPVIKPKIASYGDSYADLNETFGDHLHQHTTAGDIITSSLHNSELKETVELSKFEKTTRDYILAKLGHPIVRVELSPFQIKTCIDDAISKLNYHAPLWTLQYAVFDASADCNLYELPQWIAENLEYVVYRKGLMAIAQPVGSFESDFFITYFSNNYLFNDMAVGDFYLMTSYLKQIRKVFGQEGTWDLINGRFLQLHPAPAFTPDPVILEYRALDSNTMHSAYRAWIQKYATACAKEVLGQVRGKYATLPGPGGGAQLNGDKLIAQAEAEKTKLEEELMREIEEPPLPFSLY